MAIITVTIDIPGVKASEINTETGWIIDGDIVSIDNAYIDKDPEDDDFLLFDLVSVGENEQT